MINLRRLLALTATLPLAVLTTGHCQTPAKSRNVGKPGEMLTNGSFLKGLDQWTLEEAEAKGRVEVTAEGPKGQKSLRLEVVKANEQSWRLQLYQPGITMVKGKRYELKFWCKAKAPVTITVNCMQNHAPWEHHGAATEVSLTTEWKAYSFKFEGPWDDAKARITFTNLGTAAGQVYWLADCSLKATPQIKTRTKK